MSWGLWKCVVCGYLDRTPLDNFVSKCPSCGAEYELVEWIQPHVHHKVAICRLKGTDQLNVVRPTFFAAMLNTEDFKKYQKVLCIQAKREKTIKILSLADAELIVGLADFADSEGQLSDEALKFANEVAKIYKIKGVKEWEVEEVVGCDGKTTRFRRESK